MSLHRQNADMSGLNDTPWTLRDFFMTCLAVVAICGTIFLAQRQDEADDAQLRAQAEIKLKRIAMPADKREAYQQGLNDAMAAVRDTPDGIALAQACLAQGARR